MMRDVLMHNAWIWLAVLYPLLTACLVLSRRHPACLTSAVLRTAPLPALLAAVFAGTHAGMNAPWLMMGMRFELTDITRLFLLFTSLLWTIAGWYAVRYVAHDPHRRRFAFYYLLSLTGNIGLIVAADIPGFYTFFALMTFAAYGLVVHNQEKPAFRAGRIYIAMAILGEAMILTALLLIAFTGDSLLIREAVPQVSGSGVEHAVIGLILFGFGIKAGLFPLHGWLPLAHPVAPTPASAVLSGAMIKAGLLGWILFLPGGYASYPQWGSLVIALGLFGAFYAVVVGITQTNPKTNLAYSSISQMGIMTVCIGIGLTVAADWSTAVLIASIYALNHAFAKGALFMGVGVALAESRSPRAHRRIILAGLALAALAVAGAPMTGGALAKRALKYFATSSPHAWGPTLDVLLPLSALATTLLLARFLFLVHAKMSDPEREADGHRGLMPAWGINLIAVSGMAWLTITTLQIPVSTEPFTIPDLVKSTLPIAGGLLLAVIAYLYKTRLRRTIPAGDLVIPFERGATRISLAWIRHVSIPLGKRHLTFAPILDYLIPKHRATDGVRLADIRMRRFEVSGALFILIIAAFILALLS